MNKGIILVALFTAVFSVNADVLCLKKSAAVKSGNVTLKNAMVVRPSTCPSGYVKLVNTDSFVKQDSIVISKMQDSTVSSSKIQDAAVTTPKIADAAITEIKIQDGAISSRKIADGAVTLDKLASGIINRSISINPVGTQLGGTATFGTGYGSLLGIQLPDAGVPHFYAGFTIPQDYTPGDPISVKMLVSSPSTSCAIAILPNSISVNRAGSAAIVGTNVATGLSSPPTFMMSATSYSSVLFEGAISAPDATQLLPGDAVIFSYYRGTDSCTGVARIHSIEIQY